MTVLKQVALSCALVLFFALMANAKDNNQTATTWEKGSIPEKGYQFFIGIEKDIKSFLVNNKIIDDKNLSKNITTDK